jgi:hypothetical protein
MNIIALMQFIEEYNIHFNSFSLNENQFDHHSKLHGILHTYRVMVHTLRLGILTGRQHEATTAFFAAYIHDMARKHDGYCTQHGADSANYKLPSYRELFSENGATENEILLIGKAVTLHSTNTELQKHDPDWMTVAILKDADALDRIRLGAADLNPSYLRLKESHDCIRYGEELYGLTQGNTYKSFTELLYFS